MPVLEARGSHGFHPAFQHQAHGIDHFVPARQRQEMRLAGGAASQALGDHVRHFLGEEPVAGELTADHRIQTVRAVLGVIEDLVLAGEPVFVDAPTKQCGPDAAPGTDRARLADARKHALYGLK